MQVAYHSYAMSIINNNKIARKNNDMLSVLMCGNV